MASAGDDAPPHCRHSAGLTPDTCRQEATILTLLFLLQAAYGPPDPRAVAGAGAGREDCPGAVSSDIVVCARKKLGQGDRISGKSVDVEPVLPKAEFRLFGSGRLALHGQQASVGGFTSNRAMVTLALPF